MEDPPPRPTLPAVGILSDLDASTRAALEGRLETRSLKRGDELVRQGDSADALYIVVTGRFAVTLEGREEPVAEIGANQPIGEIAFLTGGERTATVTAMRDSVVVRLGRAQFDTHLGRNPDIWRKLTSSLAQRLTRTTASEPATRDSRPHTIALIRAGHAPLPPRFREALTSVFAEAASTVVVDADNAVEIGLPVGSLESVEATQALNALETRFDYVILVADPELTPWSRKVIRHADLVLAVGMHGSDPTPNGLEHLAETFVGRRGSRLVLLHPERSRIHGTAQWLDPRTVWMHHHVALEDRADVERLFRFVHGTALGFVACGGGALCTAHVGVYKALIESGFAFDIMGGTSAGAAMAAAFAMGKRPDYVDRSTHDIFITHRAMQRYTLPRYGLLDHRNYDKQLRRYFGGVNLEDLWIPFFAVSTNLSRYELHVHRRGDLFDAIRASGSIPVLLPPVYTDDGEMLVDGCLLDNVPIGTMHGLKDGPNVVVNFRIPEMERFDVDYDALPSRAEMIGRILNPLGRRLPEAPSLPTVLMRSMMANRQDFNRHLTSEDLLLVPPMPPDIGILDWHRHTELLDDAYAWGLREVARLEAEGHPVATAAADRD